MNSTTTMPTTMAHITHHLHQFERWFNARFGWFFTNGNKA